MAPRGPAPRAGGGPVALSTELLEELLLPAPPPKEEAPPAAGPLRFTLNGAAVVAAPGELEDPGASLAAFVRARGLTGTKVCCDEGGCGACTVLLREAGGSAPFRAVNACLTPVGSLHGREVVTAEGLGGGSLPLSKVQAALAAGNGVQVRDMRSLVCVLLCESAED